MPTLDALAYPHLLDTVISHASPSTLQSLSHTCRTLHTRLTPLLHEHVTLRAARFRGEVTSPLPPFTRLRTLRPCTDEPALHLSHTRILDLCAAYGYGRPAVFPSLKIIRHPLAYRTWPMPRFPPPPERRVSEDGQFLPPERWERIEEGVYVAYLHLTHPRWHEENDVPGLYIDPPEGTRRLVLRLKWDPNYPRVRYADVVVGEVAMHADIVVVFEPVRVEPLGEPTSRDSEEGSGSWNRRRRSSSPTRPMKRPRHSSPNPTPTLHTRAPSTTEPDPDTYHDPLRGFGIFGNLCYALMNRVIEQGAAVCFVGVEACNRRELFFPPAQEDTAAAARTMLGIVLDSVLVLPEEFGWDCIHAWRSREMGEGWFDGLVATGMRRHFRFESAEAWRNEEGELRQLESGKIAWEEYEERMRDSAGVTERMVARFG